MEHLSIVETEFYLSEEEGSKTPVPTAAPPSQTRNELAEKGLDEVMLAVLDYKFSVGYATYTILDATGPEFTNAETGEPAIVVLMTLQEALDRHPLKLDDKRVLFEILGWRFECLFWGAEEPARAHLRSGPCLDCKARARSSRHPQAALVPYKIVHP